MKCVVLVPTNRNDGSKVPRSELREILMRMTLAFDAASVESEGFGMWSHEGQIYEDNWQRMMVVTDSSRKEEFLTMVQSIGKQLGQLAMFVEFSEPEVTILDIE